MSVWGEVRRLAAARHRELVGDTDGLLPAAALLDRAEAATGVKRQSRPKDDPLLDGGEACYHREKKKIYYSREPEPALAHFYVAHEYGHHWLGEVVTRCDCFDLNMFAPAEPAPSVVGDMDAYSPKERAEAQANVFGEGARRDRGGGEEDHRRRLRPERRRALPHLSLLLRLPVTRRDSLNS